MLEVERSQEEWLSFLTDVFAIGIRSLHSSSEYDSFPLLGNLLARGSARDAFPEFRHIVKIGEPSFDDSEFDAERLDEKVRAYLDALSTPILHDIQWMWRQNLKDDSHRIVQFVAQLDEMAGAICRLKQAGLIERFFCFPYSVGFGRVALEHEAVDGLVVYRNVQETEYDALLDRAEELSKPCHIIRPFNAGGAFADEGRSVRGHLAFALGKPAIESAILSSNSLDHLRQLTSLVVG
jgi:hypothetical protein